MVQQAFLDNEEAVIKGLKSAYRRSLKDITDKAAKLQKEFEELEAIYDSIDDEEEKKILKSRMRSKVYQKQYQESLQKQVGDIIGKLHDEDFKTVSEYLEKCYEDGFLGTMYDLQGQGIPMCFPLDQESMVRAVQLDSKISKGLYDHLGENYGMLKKRITAEVSRGIASSMTYAQVAQQLAGKMTGIYKNPGGALAYSMRIARTEGHRIQCQATMDACYNAKDRGADVVKQWDATLDARTRNSHAMVDGEWKELDEKFSNGLMFPGDPSGRAEEVIHCRCALLQRARWAVGNGFTKMNNFTKQLETFESPENYAEFKKAFFSKENRSYMNHVQKMEEKYGTKDFAKVLDKMDTREYNRYEKLLAGNPVFSKKALINVADAEDVAKVADVPKATPKTSTFVPAKTVEEGTQYAERFVSTYKSKYSGNVDYGKMDTASINELNKTIDAIYAAYDVPPLRNIRVMNMREKRWRDASAEAAFGWGSGDLYINGKYYKDRKSIAKHKKEFEDLLERVMPKVPGEIANLEGKTDYSSRTKHRYFSALLKSGRTNVSGVEIEGSIVHEMGHMLDDRLFGLQKTQSAFNMKASMEKYASNISAYATTDAREYVAESFSAYWKGETDILDPELVKIFEGARKK